MIGLSYLAFFLLYFFTTALLTWFAVKAARRRSIAGWKWGVPTLLAMFLLVFWDWIPTVVLHKYYCSEQAGLTVYKSVEDWKKENPEAVKTLKWRSASDRRSSGGKVVYQLNERIAWESFWKKHPLAIGTKLDRIVDKQNGDVLVVKRDVQVSTHPIGLGIRSLRDLKPWLSPYKTCFIEKERDKWIFEGRSFAQIKASYKKIGRKIDD